MMDILLEGVDEDWKEVKEESRGVFIVGNDFEDSEWAEYETVSKVKPRKAVVEMHRKNLLDRLFLTDLDRREISVFISEGWKINNSLNKLEMRENSSHDLITILDEMDNMRQFSLRDLFVKRE